MRRFMSLILVLLLCTALACPAMATNVVPGMLEQGDPDILEAKMDGQDVTECLVVTTITEAEEKTTDIDQESRDLLLQVYEDLRDGRMQLPLEAEYDILAIADVSWKETDCVGKDHAHQARLEEAGSSVTITYDLNDEHKDDVIVMTYVENQWVEAEQVTNHGDGTYTVVTADLCPVVFARVEGADESQSGGISGENVFVPSIPYKDGPDIEEGEMDGEDVGDCLVITTITEAKEKTTDITQEARDLLLEVYEEIKNGDMELPLDEDYVVRELVDVSWKETTCVEPEHGHKEWLEEEDTTLTVTFDLGVGPEEEVIVLVYINGEWVEAVSVINNGDGTVTVVFEDICPVAFCVEKRYAPPQTGDETGNKLYFFAALMGAAILGLIGLLVWRKKQK